MFGQDERGIHKGEMMVDEDDDFVLFSLTMYLTMINICIYFVSDYYNLETKIVFITQI